MAARPFADAEISALTRGFYALGKGSATREPYPNPVHDLISGLIAGGRMNDRDGRLMIAPDDRVTVVEQLRQVLAENAFVEADRKILFHFQKPDSDIRRALAGTPAIVLPETHEYVCLGERDFSRAQAAVEEVRRSTSLTDPHIRYVYGELRQGYGAGIFSDDGDITATVPRAQDLGDVLSEIAAARKPQQIRLEKIAEQMKRGDFGYSFLDISDRASRSEIVSELQSWSRWDIERLQDNLNRLEHEARRVAIPGERRNNGAPSIEETTRTASSQAESREFEQGPTSLTQRQLEKQLARAANGRSREDVESERRLLQERLGKSTDPADRKQLTDRLAQLEKTARTGDRDSIERSRLEAERWIEAQHDPQSRLHDERDLILTRRVSFRPGERYEGANAAAQADNRQTLFTGDTLRGTIAKVFPQHMVVITTTGRFALLETGDIRTHRVGVKGTLADHAPADKRLRDIARAEIPVSLRVNSDGLHFFSENPVTVQKRQEREREASELKRLEMEEQAQYENDPRSLGRELSWLKDKAENVLSRSHDLTPDAITSVQMNEREENVPYRGSIVAVGELAFYQAVGNTLVPHETINFDRRPLEGEKWMIRYAEGMEFSQAEYSVMKARDARIAQFVSQSLPKMQDERTQQIRERQLAVALNAIAQEQGVVASQLTNVVGELGSTTHVGTIVHSSPLFSFAHINSGDAHQVAVIDHREVQRTLDRGDGVTLAVSPMGLSLVEVREAQLSLDRQQSENVRSLLSDREEAVFLAQEQMALRYIAQRDGMTIGDLSLEAPAPNQKVEATLLLVTSDMTYFSWGENKIFATPTYRDVKIGTDRPALEKSNNPQLRMDKALAKEMRDVGGRTQSVTVPELRPSIELAMKQGVVTLERVGKNMKIESLDRDVKPAYPYEVHGFQAIRLSRSDDGSYQPQRFVGRVAAVTEQTVVVDLNHFDYIDLNREDVQALPDALEPGAAIRLDAQANHVEITRDREREDEQAREVSHSSELSR